MSITKNMIITDSLGQEVDRRDIGAEAQNIDVSRDADGKIITDITASGVEVSSVESLTQTLKSIENNSQITLTFDDVPITGSDNPVKSKGLVPDTALSPTSTKPVQNKIITEALSTKLSTYANNSDAWDEEPTLNSIKPVTSRGIKNVLDNFYVTAGQKSESTLGDKATAEGNETVASGDYSHAEGSFTTATGQYSHAEGSSTLANYFQCHAEGSQTSATGSVAHAEGFKTSTAGKYSHAEGSQTIIEDYNSSEGAHTEGFKTYARDKATHAEGVETSAIFTGAHAEGYQTSAAWTYCHAEGNKTTAKGQNAHSEGELTWANGLDSHAEGSQTSATGHYSHAEGYKTSVYSEGGHVEGRETLALTEQTHAEGRETSAIAMHAHAEGRSTLANGSDSHAEGFNTTTSGSSSHAEGSSTLASGTDSHAEGYGTKAIGFRSHAEGSITSALGEYSHSAGYWTVANNLQTVIGQCNVIKGSTDEYEANSGYLIVGGGTISAKANCFRVTESNTYGKTYNTSGADYAEMFEWIDGNLNNEDRIGKFVTLDGNKIKLATSNDDYILGVVSGNASVIGDVYDDQWQGMFETDIYGRPIYDKQERELEDGTKVYDDILKVNPNYDNTKEYIPRSKRSEWNAVGLLGKLICLDDGTAEINDYITINNDSIATKASNRTKYRVMKRVDENHIQIMIL